MRHQTPILQSKERKNPRIQGTKKGVKRIENEKEKALQSLNY